MGFAKATGSIRGGGRAAWRLFAAAALSGVLACGLAGCDEDDREGFAGAAAGGSTTFGQVAGLDKVPTAPPLTAGFVYSDRDLDGTYDAAAATSIAFAGGSAKVSGPGASADGGAVTVSAEGVYVVTGKTADGCIVVNAPDLAKVQIVLAGAEISNPNGPAICIVSADKCFVTLAAGTANALSDGADYVLDVSDPDAPNAALFSMADLTVNGSGSLTVAGSCRHAVNSKDDLVITGGTFRIRAAEDALRGRDCVMLRGGTFDIAAGEDGIESVNDKDAGRGYVGIDGADVRLTAVDDAVSAVSDLAVSGGTLKVVSCTEGLEAQRVFLSGGRIEVTASDDAVNAVSPGSGGKGALKTDPRCLISVSGGQVLLDACGDALDSNGSVVVSGGTLLVNGPSAADFSMLDFGTGSAIAGGTVLMVGPAQGAQGFTAGSQAFALGKVQGRAGQEVGVALSGGAAFASIKAARDFSAVLVSSPELAAGGSVAVSVGGTVTEIPVSA